MKNIFLSSMLFVLYSLNANATVDVESLKNYQQCIMCHGVKADKMAMDRAEVLSSLKKEDILAKIKRVQKKENIHFTVEEAMHRRLKDLTDEDAEALADFIIDKSRRD